MQPKTLKLSPMGKQLLNSIECDSEEHVIGELRKHPIGLVFIYLSGLFVATVLTVLTMAAGFYLQNSSVETGADNGLVRTVVLLVGFILVMLTFIGMLITAYLYERNVILITNEKLAQVTYISLFNRKISQLGLGEIEDVTVSQIGILPRLLDYGTINIETAGEHGNFSFTFAPSPNKFSKMIVGAHEENVHQFGN